MLYKKSFLCNMCRFLSFYYDLSLCSFLVRGRIGTYVHYGVGPSHRTVMPNVGIHVERNIGASSAPMFGLGDA